MRSRVTTVWPSSRLRGAGLPRSSPSSRARRIGSRSTATRHCRTCCRPAADRFGTTWKTCASAGANGMSRACCRMFGPRMAMRSEPKCSPRTEATATRPRSTRSIRSTRCTETSGVATAARAPDRRSGGGARDAPRADPLTCEVLLQEKRALERRRRTLERLPEDRHEDAPAVELGQRVAQALGTGQRVVLVAARLEAGRGRQVIVRAHGHDQKVGVMDSDVGGDLPRDRIDADNRLLAELDTFLRGVAIGNLHVAGRLPAEHHVELREAEMERVVAVEQRDADSSATVSESRVANSSPPKPAPRMTTCRLMIAILLPRDGEDADLLTRSGSLAAVRGSNARFGVAVVTVLLAALGLRIGYVA